MIIQASLLEVIVTICALFGAGLVCGWCWHALRTWRAEDEAAAADAAEYPEPSPGYPDPEPEPEPEPLPHLGGPAPLGWETPAEEIERLETRLNALYAADRDRIREECDRLAAELLGDVHSTQELLAAGTLARADWIRGELVNA